MRRRNRTRLQALLYSPITLVAAVVVFALTVRASWSIHEKARDSALRLEVAQSELAKLQASETELSASVGALSSPAGIKSQIREKYHAVEPGESVAIIVDSTSSASAAALNGASDASSTDQEGRSWWQRFLGGIGL